ncbi:MAG: hypothetical protein ACP5XB_08225 [Isosphaeraceae bacterium]
MLAVLGGLGWAVDLRAQTSPAPAQAATAQRFASGVTPLAHYVPRDNLVFYLEFDGLDAHAEAWQKTAAYKMLNNTPLGSMLEEVVGQLLEKPLSLSANRKLTGAEVVTLVKAMAHKGWVVAVQASDNPKQPFLVTIVFRGLAAKDVRSLSGRLMGMLMGSDKPKIERRGDRPLIMLTNTAGQPSGVWWTEKDDLVLGGKGTADADAIIAALDGKTPSAAEHPVLSELSKPEGSFVPLLTLFLDPSAISSKSDAKVVEFCKKIQEIGLNRIDYRWGFDGDALMSITRLVVPEPRKSLFAMFDQPKLDTKQLIPIPGGVDSFAIFSVSPAKVLDALAKVAPTGTKAKMDEFFARLKEQNRVDFEKDLLGHLGPKMAFYLAPGRSATTTDETPEPAAKTGGFDPTALLSSLTSALPKPTLVAELDDPKAFGRALDAVMISVNKELKTMAIEKAAAEEAEDEKGNTPGAAGVPGQMSARRQRNEPAGGAGSGRRSTRKRSSKEVPAPEFRLTPGSATSRSYRLTIPTDSPLKFGGSGIHPTIRMEGKYVAFSSTSEAAREAIDLISKKDWKPSADIAQAVSHVPSDLILLAVLDPRETMPGLLASLPGTLQSQVNTLITMSTADSAADPGNAGPGGMPGAPGYASRGGPGSMMMAPGPGGSGGYSGMSMSQPGGPPGSPPAGYPGMSAPGGQGPGASEISPADLMIELKVDPSKLPKAEALKALMFPGTLAVAVDGQSIRFVTRDSFPNFVAGLGGGSVGTALLLPAIQVARDRARQAAAANAKQGAGSSGQPAAGPGAGPGATPPGPGAGDSRPGPGGPGRGGRRGMRQPGGGGPPGAR